jgi:hypothetical protein
MRKLSSLAVRIALVGAATSGIVAACYDQVPGPSGPLPPTKEAKPFGSKPKRIKPAVELNPKFGAHDDTPLTPSSAHDQTPPAPSPMQRETRPAPSPTHDATDAGVADTLELPPVPDASVPLDAPTIRK